MQIPDKYKTEICKIFREIESLKSEKVDTSAEIKAKELRLEEIRKEYLRECFEKYSKELNVHLA